MKYIFSGLLCLFITNQIIAQHIAAGSTSYNGNIYHLDNNVGVGTSMPDAKLVVHNQNINAPSYLKVSINDGTKQLELLNTTDDSSSDKHTIFSMINKRKLGSAANGGATLFSLTYDATELKSASEIATSNLTLSNGDLNSAVINFYNHNSDYSIFQESKLLEINANENYVRTNISTQHADHFRWDFDNSEKMRVTSQGNVGIGTSTLGAKFHVFSNSSDGILIESGAWPELDMISANDFRARFTLNSSTGDFQLRVGQSANGVDGSSDAKLSIAQNGNVGIGTTNPDSRLTVKGDIHAEEVKVDLNVPGPDYVFEEGYDLLSLESIKSYINANKHLPEVPSAKEMEEDGIDLGTMNMLLLKKVEELTLHLIEQNDKIKAQNEKIVELENLIKSK